MDIRRGSSVASVLLLGVVVWLGTSVWWPTIGPANAAVAARRLTPGEDPGHGLHDGTSPRRPVATEAVAALLRICFEDLRQRRVVAHCFADNDASWRLMERLGMRREMHTRAESLHRSRGWLDGMSYGLLAEEWRAAQP